MSDRQIPYGLHNAELSLVAVPGMPQTNIQVIDDQTPSANGQNAFDQIASTLNDLQEHLKVLKEKRAVNGRAVVAAEAIERLKDESVDFFRAPFRDVMRQLS